MVSTQVDVPLQAPDHPTKVEPEAGAAVKVTLLPVGKFAEQVAPHEIPTGLLVTVPVPDPATFTLN
jgi:hypothetical protein